MPKIVTFTNEVAAADTKEEVGTENEIEGEAYCLIKETKEKQTVKIY